MTNPSPTSAVAAAWAGGMSLDSLVEGIRANGVGSTQQSVDTQRFWSTPARPAEDTSVEIMQITFSTARRINQIEFDLAIFPQDVTVEFYDDQTKAWTSCLDSTATTPSPITAAIRNAVPGVLPNPSAVTGHLHPQHSFTGHWRTVNFSIRPVMTKILRVLLTRSTLGTPPTNPQGVPMPYSLAVRNLNLTYKIQQLSDVPWTPPTTGDQRDTFGSTSDMFNSVVDFSVRVNVATNAIGTTTGANGLTTVWKSEPQPIPWAVVNYYLDCRDMAGEGQTIDRLYLDPLYDGPTVNLYWSNSEPDGLFKSNSDPIPPVIAQVNNSAGITGDVLHFDNPALADAIGFVDLLNSGIAFDPSRAWWIGGQLNWKFKHGTQNEDHPILDCGAFTLSWTPQGPLLTTEFGDELLLITQTESQGVTNDPNTGLPVPIDAGPTFITIDPSTPVSFAIWYDGTNIGLAIRFGRDEFSGSQPISLPFTRDVSTIRVGGWLGDSPGVFDAVLQALTIKQDQVLDEDIREDFLADPEPYVLGSTYLGVSDVRTDNTLVRYHPSFYTTDFPAAMIGGAPDRYADMSWTPVARDYVLRQGFMYFSPQRAKYWKLEFTNLSPQPYEVYQPVQKSVQVFPSAMWQQAVSSTGNATTAGLSKLFPGQDNVYVVNTLTQTLDANQAAVVGTGATSSNTTARIVYDEDARARVGEAYWAWSFLPTHTTGVTPSFESTGVHNYQVIDYKQVTKLGYMVGLRTIGAYKLNYVATDDVDQYQEMFYDTTNLASTGNWTLTEDHLLTSGASTYSEVTSQAFPSNRVVSAVQFAAQQSEPVQLLPDPELTSGPLMWDTVGDAVMTDSSAQNPALGSTQRIDRSGPPMTWAAVAAAYVLWSGFTSQNASWGQVQAGTQAPSGVGGISSKPVILPPGGRVHVAARVSAPQDLTLPLSVQIVDAATEAVLAESDVTVKSGQITEWYADYTIGDGVTNVPYLWRDFGVGYGAQPMLATFQGPNQLNLPPMDTGQNWSWPVDTNGNPASLNLVSNAAQVQTEGWIDIANTGTPWGTLEVTVGTMGTTSGGVVSLLRLNPLFLTETGYLGNLSGSPTDAARSYVLTNNNSPYAVQPGDVLRMDFLPADRVPSDKLDAGRSPLDQYAIMFWVNGVWKCTRNHPYGSSVNKAIKGRLGQRFTRFSFTPADYGKLPGSPVYNMPRKGLGSWVDPTTMQQFTDYNGYSWKVGTSNPTNTPTAAWDLTNNAEQSNREDLLPPLVAGSNDAVFWHDTGNWDGQMSFRLRNLAMAANLAVNGSFATNTTGWSGRNSTTLARQASGGPNGSPYCLCTSGGSTFGITSSASITTGIVAGNVHKLELDVLPNASTTNLTLNVDWSNSSGTFLSTTVVSVSASTGSWQHLVSYHQAPIGAARAVIYLNGTLASGSTFGVANIGFGKLSGYAACLDFDNKVYLDVHGNLVQNGAVVQTGFVPAPLPVNTDITIAFYNQRQYTAGSGGRTIQAEIARTVVGTVNATPLASITGTKRGLAGSQYGDVPNRPVLPSYQVDTAFSSFNWSTSALLLASPASAPTWGQVTKNGTATYAEILARKPVATQTVLARVVQRGPTSDVWDIDTISLFADPIVWSFSNDGGYTWFPAYEIRNNPEGVMVFPESLPILSFSQKAGTYLVWRAVSYRPNSTISSLVIRPWYGGLMSGIDYRAGLVATSPNVMPYDNFGDIHNDARFQVWNNPIPRWWWFKYKSIQRAIGGTTPTPSQPAGYPGPQLFPGPNVFPGVS